VVIVGGGYAGVTLARELDAAFEVVLLERRDRFYHNVGAMRAYVDPALFQRLLIPFDRLLRRGRVVQDDVLAVEAGGVRASGQNWEADVVVVASGSRHVMPFKSEFTQSTAFLAEAERMSARLAAAGSIAILGDGPVAVELAGEVSWRYPDKRLQLVAAGNRLLPGAGNPRLGEKLLAMLRGRGVTVVFGQRQAAGVDLVIQGFGASISVPCLGATGRVPVDGRFAVAGMSGVFAIGDAADCGEPPLTFLARRQALHLAKQLRDGRATRYQPATRVPMAVPLGPELGAVQLPLPALPVVGSWLTSRLKGRDLFVVRNRALLGWKD
jgi:NADH dehydrogenase FAD-containing subunit